MVTIWTSLLIYIAEVANFFSVIGVLICFMCMVVFIVRLQDVNWNGPSVVHVSQPPVYRVDVQKVLIPFFCTLVTITDSNDEEIHLNIQNKFDFKLFIFWEVSVRELWRKIHLPFSSFCTQLEDALLLDAAEAENPREVELSSERLHTFKLKIKHHATKGPPPRLCFPLVVIVCRTTLEEECTCQEVGAVISVIHIADTDCPMKTCILYQFLKQHSGRISNLKALYTQKEAAPEIISDMYINPSANETSNSMDVPSETVDTKLFEHRKFVEKVEDPIEDAHFNPQSLNAKGDLDDNSESNDEDSISYDEACVVCQIFKTTRALLPCRHVCVCNRCFVRLENCPMCRTRIQAYFVTDEAEEASQEISRVREERSIPATPPPSLLDRMNQYVGF